MQRYTVFLKPYGVYHFLLENGPLKQDLLLFRHRAEQAVGLLTSMMDNDLHVTWN